ncbi:MAG: glycosyltransferase, partial [Mycobacterium sp.]|nr:glycosyltransferase [Mycobacterium sp.]
SLEIRDGTESSEFPDFLAAADVLLVNERHGMLEMSLPGKLTSYLSAGRPVVAATESAGVTAELLEASGGGVVVQPSNPEALLKAVITVGRDTALANALGKAGQQFALGHFDSGTALTAYQSWVEGLNAI